MYSQETTEHDGNDWHILNVGKQQTIYNCYDVVIILKKKLSYGLVYMRIRARGPIGWTSQCRGRTG